MVRKNFVNPYIDGIKEFTDIVISPEDALIRRGIWKDSFPGFNLPINLDIGCGNGELLVNFASHSPQKIYIGFELQYKEVYRTALKIKRLGLSNCKVLRMDASVVPEVFERGELGDINIFFPDPWPKKRHRKNRLIKKDYIRRLLGKLIRGSYIKMKTDNDDYFMQIFDVFNSMSGEFNIKLLEFSRDLHSTDYARDDYITAFERIFLRQGLMINYALYQLC